MTQGTVGAEPPLSVMSLHALAYCERLFYLEEIERLRVASAKVYAGRELHALLADADDGERVNFELQSPTWNLIGKVDCLKQRDGNLIPYEHKRGRSRKADDGGHEAWDSDRLQIIAYAMLLEESLGVSIPEGRIRYHASNVTVRITIDETARADFERSLSRAVELSQRTERPPITDNDRLCTHCSLAPVCLPEEVRQAKDPSREPIRLFPEQCDGAMLHVVSQGARVGCSKDSLVVQPRDEPEKKYPVRGVDTVLLHGYSQISTQAIRLCVEHQVGVHWLSTAGYHTASLAPTAGQVQRRIRQYKALSDDCYCLHLAKLLVTARMETQNKYLLRGTRGDEDARNGAQTHLQSIQKSMRMIPQVANRDALRGYEGAAAAAYFEGMRSLLNESVPEELKAVNRNRRPPLDRFNAMLSFGYGLLHTAVMRGVLASGLEPALGFYHTPRSAAYPLVLDLMELFRVPLWDMVVVGSLNRGQWKADEHFVVTGARVWLSESGRKLAISLFEDRLTETWKHPVVNYSLSYTRAIELEARLLEKEWSGEPGLFARARLR